MRHAKKKKNMIYTRKKGDPRENVPQRRGMMVGLVDKDFKSTIITVLR